ncbi:Histidine protein kinase 1 [Candida viswanathii]|uniref:histidine kinase n=1 Tax=Candida viswanathii TaxID=5486 RepID=A0A367XPH7_9ASCO|nr:Histidine protein kinase 1 [Candida viswanathii]
MSYLNQEAAAQSPAPVDPHDTNKPQPNEHIFGTIHGNGNARDTLKNGFSFTTTIKVKKPYPARPTKLNIPVSATTTDSSQPPSALSLDTPTPLRDLDEPPIAEIALNEYSFDHTISARAFDETLELSINIHQSMANLMEERSSIASTKSIDETVSSLSSDTSENVSLGNSSYLNNINYMRSHLEYLSQNLNSNISPKNLLPAGDLGIDSANLMPDSIPGFNLLKRFGTTTTQTNLVYNGVKKSSDPTINSCKLVCPERGGIEMNTHVLIRLSPNLYKNMSLSRFLNEWYLLSGQNTVCKHRTWSNETLVNKYTPELDIPIFDKEAAKTRATLPTDLSGVLYPHEVLSFTVIDDDHQLKHPSEFHTQKRFALVYKDNEYRTFKEISADGPLDQLNHRQGSFSSGGSRRKSIGSGSSVVTPTTEGVDFLTSGNSSTNDLLFRKLSKFVCSNPKTSLKVIEILSDFIKVVETLGVVHELGFVHNGLTSSHLLKSAVDGTDIKISGWGFAFSYLENCTYGYRKRHLSQIPDMIPYMAPEVSGVVNRDVDYRSDFYSLGVILYEILLGTLPFKSNSPQTMIRMHIFQKPVSPYLLASSWITEKLSSVIMKLLEKDPTQRYTDCYSLLRDLIAVKNVYIDKVKSLGDSVWNHWSKSSEYLKYLVKETLLHPEKVGHSPVLRTGLTFIGRECFYNQVMDSFRSCRLDVNLFFLSGDTGTGKTLILNDLRTQAFLKYDFYCCFKFSISTTDNYMYKFLVDGVQKIIGQILECSQEIQDSWRELIVQNIPLDMSILFYLIPDFKKLLGAKYTSIYQHKSSVSTPGTLYKDDQTARLETKFRQILKEFYKIIAMQGLTIFMDDLQWCSQESWTLFCDILNFADLGDDPVTVKIVTAYTLNHDQLLDFDINERMEKFFKYAKQSKMKLNHFAVPPILKEAGINYIMESAGFVDERPTNNPKLASSRASPTSTLVPYQDNSARQYLEERYGELYDVSQGNAILMIYASRMARIMGHMHYVQDGSYGYFLLDISKTGIVGVSRDEFVVRFMKACTTPEAKDLINIAAVISTGAGFHLSDLTVASGLPMGEVFKLLQICVAAKLVVPTSTYYKVPFHLICSDETPFDLSDDNIWELASLCSYRFYHDSLCSHTVRQLTLSGKFKEISRLCGLRFYNTITKERILNIGGYLQMAVHFRNSYEVAKPEENEKYVEVLVQAGRYALSTYNMKLSQWFFEVIGELVYNLDSKTQLKAVLTIAQNHFNLGEFTECLEVMQNAQKKFGFDRLVFSLQLIRCQIELGQLDEAYQLAIESLQTLGVPISFDDKKNRILHDKLMRKLPLSVPEIRHIMDGKTCTNNRTSLMYQIVCEIIPPLRMDRKDELRNTLVVYAMSQIYSHGSSPYCALFMLDFATNFLGTNTSSGIIKAKELCLVAIGLVNRAPEISMSYAQSIYDIYICSCAIFFDSIEQMLNYVEMGMDTARNDALSSSSVMDLLVGISKIVLLYTSGKGYKSSMLLKSRSYLRNKSTLSYGNNFVYDCEGLLFGKMRLNDFMTNYDFSGECPVAQFCYYVVVLQAMAVEKRYEEAADLILNKVEAILEKCPVLLLHQRYYVLAAKVLTYCQKRSIEEETLKSAILERHLEKFKLWTQTNETTFGSKLLIMEAMEEIRKPDADNLRILDIFEESIDVARKHGLLCDVLWSSFDCARWLVYAKQSKRRIGKMAKQGLDILRRLEMADFIKFYETEFIEYVEEDKDIKLTWGGLLLSNASDSMGLRPLLTVNTSLFNAPPSRRSNGLAKKTPYHSHSHHRTHPAAQLRIAEEEPPVDLNMAIRECLAISEAPDEKNILLELLSAVIKFSEAEFGVVVSVKNGEPMLETVGSDQHVYSLDKVPLSSRTDICPYQLLIHVLHTGETINKDADRIDFVNRFENEYFEANDDCTCICMPLKNQWETYGVIYLEGGSKSDRKDQLFNDRKCDILLLFCYQATVALGKNKLLSQMEIAKMAAEDATAEKASFLANMSHEIRTPFNSLLSFSIFLLDTNLTHTQRDYVEAIKTSAMITLNIIDGILAFSKIEHGSFTLDNAPFSLNDCIESAIQLGGEVVTTNEIELVFFNNCPEIESVVGDVTRFRQIVINLVGNAIKFTSAGHVSVSCSATKIADERYEIKVSVEDTGIGIPEQSQQKVFGAFSQVDGSSRREFGGAGLGLAISKKLAEIMGGKLRFESDYGHGTTFYLTVGLRATVAASAPSFERGTNQKCLIYTSHELTSLSLKNALDYFQFNATVVKDISEISNVNDFDLIFVGNTVIDKFVKSFKEPPTGRIIVLTRFGVPLAPEHEKYDSLLCPFQRERLKRIIEKQPIPSSRPSQDSAIANGKLADLYPLRILLAEDNLLNYKVCSKHLEKLGYKADHAKDGVVVLEKCNELLEKGEKYDVILMDIQMPRKDGLAATKELKESFYAKDKGDFIPLIVALTANVAGDDKDRCVEVGMVDFISKPILPGELKKVLTKLGEIVHK